MTAHPAESGTRTAQVLPFSQISGRDVEIPQIEPSNWSGQATAAQPWPMTDIDRIDHSVLYTTDLDATAATYEALGFTLSPLSMHRGSDRPGGERKPMGAGNRCALFGANYLELLGLFGDGSVDPWNIRPLIAQYEGLHGYSFGCADAAVTEERLRKSGLSSSGILPLQRDVDTAEGSATARFQAIHLDRELTPEGLVHAACHLTPELIHQPRYLQHANGAVHLNSVLLVVDDGDLAATVRRYADILDTAPVTDGPCDVLRLPLGRLEITGVSRLADVLPGEQAPALPYMAAQTVAVIDLDAARKLVERNGFSTRDLPDGSFFVGASQARGAALGFCEVRR